MGTQYAWQSFGDGASPDIQAAAKGLGGGYVQTKNVPKKKTLIQHSYATIGAVFMNKRVADGVRDTTGFWKHGHTYQVCDASFFASQKYW
jgi:adenosylmethionine-8-amino-7-oxononanoate aminotransferase